MPCCAFAAAIIAQLLVGLRVLKRTFWGADEASAARNPAVEWRLEPASARPIGPPPSSSGRLLGPWSLGGLAFAAAIEAAIVLGVVYGLLQHAGHGAAHSHVQNGGAGYVATDIRHGTIDRSTSNSGILASHD